MVVALAGFEPAMPVPRTGVLPLDHSAKYNLKKNDKRGTKPILPCPAKTSQG